MAIVSVNNKEEDIQNNQEIDEEYEPQPGIGYFDDEEDEVTSLEEFGKFGEIDILQGFGTNSEDEFLNGLINFDEYEYEFEFVDDDQNNEEAKEKDLNDVVSDFPDKFGKTTNSTNICKTNNKKRKISGVGDFPDGIEKKTRTVSLEQVQEKRVKVWSVERRKTSSDSVCGFSDEGNVVVLALQAPQFCPWRDSKGCLKKGRSCVSRRTC